MKGIVRSLLFAFGRWIVITVDGHASTRLGPRIGDGTGAGHIRRRNQRTRTRRRGQPKPTNGHHFTCSDERPGSMTSFIVDDFSMVIE